MAVARAKVSVWMAFRLMPTISAPVSSCDTARMARRCGCAQEQPEGGDRDERNDEGHQAIHRDAHTQNSSAGTSQ